MTSTEHVVTVLTSTWEEARACKYWKAGLADVEDYKIGRRFTVREVPCTGIHDVYALVQGLRHDPTSFVIRGARNPLAEEPINRKRRGDDPGIRDTLSPLIVLDLDRLHEYDSVDSVLIALGAPWSETTCVVQRTGSDGIKGMRLRLWYWGDVPLRDDDLAAKLVNVPVHCDLSVCQGHQPIYTADPIFESPEDAPDVVRFTLRRGTRGTIPVGTLTGKAVTKVVGEPRVTAEPFTGLQLLQCEQVLRKKEHYLETCRSDRPTELLKAAGRVAPYVQHGYSSREVVTQRLLEAYATSYEEETCDGARDAGIDETTLEEARRLIDRAFGYAHTNPAMLVPATLNERSVKRADTFHRKARKRLKEAANAEMLGHVAGGYRDLIESGLVSEDVAREEMVKSATEGGLGATEALSQVQIALSTASAAAKEEAADWMRDLQLTDTGDGLYTYNNLLTIFERHPDMKGKLWYDNRSLKPMWVSDSPWGTTGEVTEADCLHATLWLKQLLNMKITGGIDAIARSLKCVAEKDSRDPFQEYLEGLEWDGVERLDTWLPVYAGTPDTRWERLVGAKTLISAVARTYEPGCKVDTMLVIESAAQGKQKSTLVRSLLADPSWLVEGMGANTGDKDMLFRMHGPVIMEVPELDMLKGKEVTRVKSLLSTRVDYLRIWYGKTYANYPRRSIMIGTTNESDYLQDTTGNRRFWPVTVDPDRWCDPVGCAEVRDQLWAEAKARYLAGEQWFLGRDDTALASEHQDARVAASPTQDRLERLLELPVKEHQKFPIFGTDQLDSERKVMWATGLQLAKLLGNHQPSTRDYADIKHAMQGLGWIQRKDRLKGPQLRYYTRP